METIHIIVKNVRYDDVNSIEVIEAFYDYDNAIKKFTEIMKQVKEKVNKGEYEDCDPLSVKFIGYQTEFDVCDDTIGYYENVAIVEAKLS